MPGRRGSEWGMLRVLRLCPCIGTCYLDTCYAKAGCKHVAASSASAAPQAPHRRHSAAVDSPRPPAWQIKLPAERRRLAAPGALLPAQAVSGFPPARAGRSAEAPPERSGAAPARATARAAMFYSAQILSKKGPLGPIWIASWSQGRLKRTEVFNCSLPAAVGAPPPRAGRLPAAGKRARKLGDLLAAPPSRPPPRARPPPMLQMLLPSHSHPLPSRPLHLQTRSSTQRRRSRCACRASCCWAWCASTCASCSCWRRMRGWRCAAWRGCVPPCCVAFGCGRVQRGRPCRQQAACVHANRSGAALPSASMSACCVPTVCMLCTVPGSQRPSRTPRTPQNAAGGGGTQVDLPDGGLAPEMAITLQVGAAERGDGSCWQRWAGQRAATRAPGAPTQPPPGRMLAAAPAAGALPQHSTLPVATQLLHPPCRTACTTPWPSSWATSSSPASRAACSQRQTPPGVAPAPAPPAPAAPSPWPPTFRSCLARTGRALAALTSGWMLMATPWSGASGGRAAGSQGRARPAAGLLLLLPLLGERGTAAAGQVPSAGTGAPRLRRPAARRLAAPAPPWLAAWSWSGCAARASRRRATPRQTCSSGRHPTRPSPPVRRAALQPMVLCARLGGGEPAMAAGGGRPRRRLLTTDALSIAPLLRLSPLPRLSPLLQSWMTR